MRRSAVASAAARIAGTTASWSSRWSGHRQGVEAEVLDSKGELAPPAGRRRGHPTGEAGHCTPKRNGRGEAGMGEGHYGPASMPDLTIEDFERTTFTHGGKTRTVFRRGTGPAVIVISEMPGISPKVLRFAGWVADIGCTAVLPHLFGRPGRDPAEGNPLQMTGYALSSLVPACISREFATWATGKTSPVVDWLRALAAHEHDVCGGPGVGAIGMCFTGGYALAMATDDRLLAPVLSQPSAPFGITSKQKRSIDCSPEDLAVVKQRCAAEGLKVLGLRFKRDRFVPAERFRFLEEELGDGFVAVELDDEHANQDAAVKHPHSVLTEHFVDEPGSRTRETLEQVLDLFRAKLLVA
jgi:dienelactone hydrolase